MSKKLAGFVGRQWLVGLVGAALLLVGCGGPQNKSEKQEQSHLKTLCVLYGQYIMQHQGKAPPSEAEFKKYIKELSGHPDVDALFVSERDKKPYVIVYSQGEAPNVIGYEQEGSGGKRFLATSVGSVDELDAAQFKAQVPNAK
jgi:hypothetical protein